MSRVKRGVLHLKRRKALLKRTKGFKWGRKNLIKLAKVADKKAGADAYVGRKLKKRTARALWQTKLNAALRPLGLTYSRFIDRLKKLNIELDRKVLSELAVNSPEIFKNLVAQVKDQEVAK